MKKKTLEERRAIDRATAQRYRDHQKRLAKIALEKVKKIKPGYERSMFQAAPTPKFERMVNDLLAQ